MQPSDTTFRSDNLLYLNLLPPSPVIRETNKVALWFSFFAVLLALGCNDYSFRVLQIRSAKNGWQDVATIACLLSTAWFTGVLIIALFRLCRYKRAAGQTSPQLFFFAYPWMILLAINFTALVILTERRLFHFDYSLLRAIVWMAPLAFLEIPALKKILPEHVEALKNLFPASLPVMLGPEMHSPAEKHATDIQRFHEKYEEYLSSQGGPESKVDSQQYYRSDTLDAFQKTLSCLYDTSHYVGELIRKEFAGKQWSMIDVGGAEGIFTSEALSHAGGPPTSIEMIDPSREHVEQYRDLMQRQYPTVRTFLYASRIEDVAADLPKANFILASHSLYALLDYDRGLATRVLSQLLTKLVDGVCVVILASCESQIYEIKRRVLGQLNVLDRSSFGEDFLSLVPPAYNAAIETRDSFVNVTPLLQDNTALLQWLGYFCRIDPNLVRPQFDYFRHLIKDSSIAVSALPAALREMISSRNLYSTMGLDQSSRVLFHKEYLIRIEKASDSR